MPAAALHARSSRLALLLACFVTLGYCFGTSSVAAQEIEVVRVEEDWELVVLTPDEHVTAPQVVCAISPNASLEAVYATFEVNHQSSPEFTPGGLQLQVWQAGEALSSSKYPEPAVLTLDNEVLSWTQSMEVAEGQLTFEVLNGKSATWGEFGGQGHLKFATPVALANLNHYSPDVSVANSGVSYGANLVKSLKLQRVRLYLASGEILEDATVRTVFEQN